MTMRERSASNLRTYFCKKQVVVITRCLPKLQKTCGKWDVKNIFFVSVTNENNLNTYSF